MPRKKNNRKKLQAERRAKSAQERPLKPERTIMIAHPHRAALAALVAAAGIRSIKRET